MLEIGPFGALVMLGVLVQTLVAAFFASRNKYLSRRSKRLNQLEQAHLDLLDWAYQARKRGAARGWDMPTLPDSVATMFLEEVDETTLELEMLQKQVVRRHERDSSP